jgi:hypothetical protein
MGLMFDSFWRAAAYCLRPRVMLLSAAPLALMLLLALVLHYLYWDAAVVGMTAWLDTSAFLAAVQSWLPSGLSTNGLSWLSVFLLVLMVSPVLIVVSLLTVALLATPALVNMVARRRFPLMVRKRGGSFIASALWSITSVLMALLALMVSMPLWLVPPLSVYPPAFDRRVVDLSGDGI